MYVNPHSKCLLFGSKWISHLNSLVHALIYQKIWCIRLISCNLTLSIELYFMQIKLFTYCCYVCEGDMSKCVFFMAIVTLHVISIKQTIIKIDSILWSSRFISVIIKMLCSCIYELHFCYIYSIMKKKSNKNPFESLNKIVVFTHFSFIIDMQAAW